jgi:Holliday junction resolvase RusA-like endonuclease
MARRKFLFMNPVKICYVLSFNSARPRDLDNYIGGTKYITDALKKTFFIRDDAAWVKSIEVQFVNGKEQTQITITEV